MKKTLFEQNGGSYTQHGDYLLPNIKLPEQPGYEIGVWGNRRRQYLKRHHRVLYYNMLTQCTLYPHLADVEHQAQELLLQLIDQLTKQVNVTEKLKEENTLLWVQKMISDRNQVTEIVNQEIIYT